MGRWRFKNAKNIVSLSSLSQHVTHFPNTAGKHGVLYRAWWCEPTDGVQKWNPESSRYLKVFKTWEWPILDCSIPGECLKISEVPLQNISAVPRNLLVTPVHVPGPDKIIAEPTVRQTVWQKLSLYLATLWFQITKQSYKKLGKKNGQLLNWFKLKKKMVTYLKFWAHCLGHPYWFNDMKTHLGKALKIQWRITDLKRSFCYFRDN